MNKLTYPTPEIAAKQLAERIKKEVECSDSYHLALSGGMAAPIVYRALSESDIDWEKVHIYFAYEFFTGAQKGFNYMLAKAHLFDKVALPHENIHPIELDGKETHEAAIQYSNKIADTVPTIGKYHRFNMVLLEMHADGHTVGIYPNNEELYTDVAPYMANKRPDTDDEVVTIGFEALGTAKGLAFYAFGGDVRFVVGNIINLMAEAKDYPANYLSALYPWIYLYADAEAMREKSYSIY